MKKKYIILTVGLAIVAAGLGSLEAMALGFRDIRDLFYPHYLEMKYTGGFTVTPDDPHNPSKITVSGLCNHSSMVVSAVKLMRNGTVINMLVKLEPAPKAGKTGNFQKEIAISNDISCITFGEDEVPIWARPNSTGKASPK